MKRLWLWAWLALVPLSLSAAPLWWQAPQGPAYQVLVYSFADSDGDGRGDLRGLTHRLDALQALGVTALWLSPLHPSSSYHGYDVLDYRAVNPALGTLADFDALVAEAHRRGIHVLMDMVFNHTSNKHPWFTEHPDWYRIKKAGVQYGSSTSGSWYTKADGTRYWSSFWEGMPDLDLENPDVVAQEKGILKFWLDRGVDGFRFDAAKEVFNTGKVPQGFPVVARSKAFWNDLRDYARSVNPAVYFIGEVYSLSQLEVGAYAQAFDGLFDFLGAQALMTLPESGMNSKLAATLEANQKVFRKVAGFVPSPFLANHDQDRAMSQTLAKFDAPGAEGWGPRLDDVEAITQAKTQALARAKDQAFVALTLPGLPYIEYGEELGLAGRRYKNDDIARRDAFPWGDDDPSGDTPTWTKDSGMLEPHQNEAVPSYADQVADPDSLLNWYRTLGTLRPGHPALQGLNYAVCPWAGSNDGSLVSYVREGGGEKLLATVNLGWSPTTLAVPAGVNLSPVVSLGPAPKAGDTVTLAPGQAVLWAWR